jgi:tetratricopeptide (TPR) repeat protein
MLVSTSTGLVLLTAGILIVALTSSNGATEPVSQAIGVLQQGTTSERRQAAEVLARVGDQRAVQPLVQALRDPDQLVRDTAEQALWSIWHRSGSAETDTRLQDGIAEMQRGAYARAVDIFTEVIDMAPGFAEGYNKRATTYYLMQEFEQSIRDCEKTLALNPVHFGALSGTGLNYLGLHDLRKALAYFERAVAVNPNMPQIQAYIDAIRKFLRDQSL